MEGTVDKQDMQNLTNEQIETNKTLTKICVKQGRLHESIEGLRDNQEDHHETLYDEKSGLSQRVQRIENYATATIYLIGIGASFIAGIFVMFKDKILAWFS